MATRKFKVTFAPSALRDIRRLETDTALQLAREINTYLETMPLPIGKTRIKKLTGYTPVLYRLRSGEFRAYYRIHSNEVIILAVTNKKDSEKLLKKLR